MKTYIVFLVFSLSQSLHAQNPFLKDKEYKRVLSSISKMKYAKRDSCLFYTDQLRRFEVNESSNTAIAQAFDGFNLIFLDENVEAFALLNNSLKTGLNDDDKKVISLAKAHLAYYFIKNRNKAFAKRYAFESVFEAIISGDSLAQAIGYHYLGTWYSSFGYSNDKNVLKKMFDSAQFFLRKAIDIAPFESQKLISLSNLGQTNYYYHKHSKSGNFTLERSIHEEVLKRAIDEKFSWAVIESHISLGLICEKEKKFNEAIEHYKNGIELATEAKDDWSLEQLYQHLISATIKRSGKDELKDIPKNVNRIKSIISKRLNEKLNKELSKIERDNQIIDQQREIGSKELEIENQTKNFNYILVFLILILISSIYFYRLNRKNKRLSLRNELLLKEQNHRVKNNLQMINSLLSLQSQKLLSTDAKEALNESQLRINSVALLHRMLYEGNQVGQVNVKEYLSTLTDEIKYAVPRKVDLQLDIPFDLFLSIEKATSLGLIVNELMTNSIKHVSDAFDLIIHLDLKVESEEIVLYYSDNGEGIDPETWNTSNSFGNQLIRIQSEQLRGKYAIKNNKGFRYELRLGA